MAFVFPAFSSLSKRPSRPLRSTFLPSALRFRLPLLFLKAIFKGLSLLKSMTIDEKHNAFHRFSSFFY